MDQSSADTVTFISKTRDIASVHALLRVRGWSVAFTVLGVVALSALTAVLLWPQFRAPGWVQDEAMLLVYPQQILHGAVPQRDFQTTYGPGGFWFLTIVYSLTSLTVTVERSVGLLYRLTIVLGMYATTRRWGVIPAILSGLIALLALPQLGLGAYAWLGALALAIWALWLMQRASAEENIHAQRWFYPGILSGFALLFRPDLVIALAVTALVFLLFQGRSVRIWFVTGAALGLSPFLVHLAMAGIQPVIQSLVIDAVFRTRSGRKLPLPSSWTLESVEFWALFAVSAWLILLSVFVWRRKQSHDGARTYLAYGLFAAALLSQPVQRADATHVNFAACAILALIPMAVVETARLFGTKAILAAIPTLVLAALVLWSEWSLDKPYRHPTSTPVTINGRTFPIGDANQAKTIEWMLGNLTKQTHAGDRLFVGPTDLSRTPLNDTYFYYLLPDLTPATYFLEMNPGSANAPGSRLASDLKTADYVILDDVYEYWKEPNTSDQPGNTQPNQVLKKMFCSDGDYGQFHVLRRCPSGG